MIEKIESNYTREERFNAEKIEQLAYHYREILALLGEDPEREGLIKTPERVAKAMSFVTKGYTQDPIEIINSAIFREEYQQMVLVKDIELFSMCEHHLLPFYGKVHIGYIPKGKVLGLSKLARIAEISCRRLQLQERITREIADNVMKAVDCDGVGVVVEAE